MFFEVMLWAGLGLIFGSFANVLILRERSGQPITGRSACPQCRRTLVWYELIPVFSFIALLGRCRTCRTRISIQYPLVEIIVALGFVAVGLAPAPLIARLIDSAIIVLFIAIAAYDIQHMEMPDIWVYSFVALAVVSGLITRWPHDAMSGLLFVCAGPLVALPLYALWRFSRGRWMGFGDVKFALGIGWLLGLALGYVALTLAFEIGAIVGIFILIPISYLRVRPVRRITSFQSEDKRLTMASEIPFGPFLICGTCIIWIASQYNPGLIDWIAGLLSTL